VIQLAIYEGASKLWQKLLLDLKKGLQDGSIQFQSGRNVEDDSDSDLAWDDSDDEVDDDVPLQINGKSPYQTVMRYFWNAHQRFFSNLCMAFRVKSAVRVARAALVEGKSVIIGLQSTGGAFNERSFRNNDEKTESLTNPEMAIRR